MKKGIKDIVAPQGMFEDLGLKYLGPIDGHDEPAVEAALRRARAFGGPSSCTSSPRRARATTRPVNDDADQFHGVGKINPETGLPFEVERPHLDRRVQRRDGRHRRASATTSWRSPPRCSSPSGSTEFAERLPRPGLRRRHRRAARRHHGARARVRRACTRSSAVYATFLNRAFDQLLMDCALHRAGRHLRARPRRRHRQRRRLAQRHVGHDDRRLVPGLRLAAPRDGEQVLGGQLREAVDVADGPTVIRFPKGTPPTR